MSQTKAVRSNSPALVLPAWDVAVQPGSSVKLVVVIVPEKILSIADLEVVAKYHKIVVIRYRIVSHQPVVRLIGKRDGFQQIETDAVEKRSGYLVIEKGFAGIGIEELSFNVREIPRSFWFRWRKSVRRGRLGAVAKALVGSKEVKSVSENGSACCHTELVHNPFRFVFSYEVAVVVEDGTIEEIRRVQCRVPVELPYRSVKVIRATARHKTDDGPRISTFGR